MRVQLKMIDIRMNGESNAIKIRMDGTNSLFNKKLTVQRRLCKLL